MIKNDNNNINKQISVELITELQKIYQNYKNNICIINNEKIIYIKELYKLIELSIDIVNNDERLYRRLNKDYKRNKILIDKIIENNNNIKNNNNNNNIKKDIIIKNNNIKKDNNIKNNNIKNNNIKKDNNIKNNNINYTIKRIDNNIKKDIIINNNIIKDEYYNNISSKLLKVDILTINNLIIEERNEEIVELSKDFMVLNSLMRNLSLLISDQNNNITNIETNVNDAHEKSKKGLEYIQKAEKLSFSLPKRVYGIIFGTTGGYIIGTILHIGKLGTIISSMSGCYVGLIVLL